MEEISKMEVNEIELKRLEFFASIKRNNDRKDIYLAKQNITKINVKDIVMVEPIHLADTKQYNKAILSSYPIIVRYEKSLYGDKPILISGIKSYKIALRENVETLPAVVFTKGKRKHFLKELGVESVKKVKQFQIFKLADIKVANNFLNSHPNKNKFDRIEKFYVIHGRLDKPIVINSVGFLIDGYVRYLIAKKHGLESVSVECTNKLRSDKVKTNKGRGMVI